MMLTLVRPSRVFFAVLLSFTALALAGCGGSYKTRTVKEYRLAVVDAEPAVKRDFINLIKDFNTYSGVEVLTYVEDANQANSAIIVTDGLQARDGKVGWGQWMSEVHSDNPISFSGKRPKRTVEFAMRLEFDRDYFATRKGTDPDHQFEKQKLFFHEVGHGLEMGHNVTNDCRDPHSAAARRDVMYCDVSGDKDFDPFFAKVRAYMQN